MSQPAGTERPPPARGAGGGGVLTRRFGGIPGWGWIVIVAAVAGGVFYIIQRRKSGSAAASTAGAAGPTQATCYDANGNTVGCQDPSAVGSNATDYFEALYAQTQGINSQLQNQGAVTTETGIDVDTLERMLKDLQGDTGEPGTTPVIPGEPPPLRNQVKIPNVAGKRAAYAVDQLHSLGFAVHTDPLRKPIDEYDATGTTPAAGLERPKGSTVVVHVKEIAKPKTTRPGTTPEIPGGPERRAA